MLFLFKCGLASKAGLRHLSWNNSGGSATSAIRMADNPVDHSRTKHIDIRHQFLRDHQQKGDIEVYHISTENQLADVGGLRLPKVLKNMI
jgi:hypothetical protein